MITCSNHPAEPVTPYDVGDRFCIACFMRAWNDGAHQADATWHVTPHDESREAAPDSRLIANQYLDQKENA